MHAPSLRAITSKAATRAVYGALMQRSDVHGVTPQTRGILVRETAVVNAILERRI